VSNDSLSNQPNLALMHEILAFYKSSIGKKIIVAITGAALVGFVFVHMIGNLQIYLGPDFLNSYAHKLQSLGPILWLFRISMLGLVGIHLFTAIQLASQNRAARPSRYVAETTVKASIPSRYMVQTGLIVLAFIVFHIFHLTVKNTDPKIAEFLKSDKGTVTLHAGEAPIPNVYGAMITTFKNPVNTGIYLLGMAFLCFHLAHGIGSLFQTVGLRNAKTRLPIELLSYGAAAVIFVGNCSIPLTIFVGLVKL